MSLPILEKILGMKYSAQLCQIGMVQLCFVASPRGYGNWSYNLFTKADEDEDNWASFRFTTLDGGRVSPRNKTNKQDLDEKTFNKNIWVHLLIMQDRFIITFDRKQNVLDIYSPKTNEIHYGMDFLTLTPCQQLYLN